MTPATPVPMAALAAEVIVIASMLIMIVISDMVFLVTILLLV